MGAAAYACVLALGVYDRPPCMHLRRAVVYHNFMSAAEADHIRSLADPSMQRSLVEGHGGHGEVNDIRTSSGTFLARQSDEVIRTVENRIAAWTMLPMPHQEDLQVTCCACTCCVHAPQGYSYTGDDCQTSTLSAFNHSTGAQVPAEPAVPRPHGRAAVSDARGRAVAVCDRAHVPDRQATGHS